MLTTHLATQRLAELLDRATADLEATRRLLSHAVARLDDSEPGYPGGGTGGATGDDSGPLRSTVILRDDALRDRALLEQRLRKLDQDARMLLRLTQKWGMRSIGETDREPDELWCRSCLRAGHMAPRRTSPGKTHGENCRWCDDTLRAVNVVRAERKQPGLAELPLVAVRWHSEGRRVTARDIEAWATNVKNRR